METIFTIFYGTWLVLVAILHGALGIVICLLCIGFLIVVLRLMFEIVSVIAKEILAVLD